MRVLLSSTVRITGQPRALCIAVSSLDIVSSELPLPVGEASNLLCQGQSPIGFSTGFVFSKTKSRARRTRSGMNGMNWDEILSMKTTLIPLIPLIPPFPKNFFKKLLPVEKVICVNTNWTFLVFCRLVCWPPNSIHAGFSLYKDNSRCRPTSRKVQLSKIRLGQ